MLPETTSSENTSDEIAYKIRKEIINSLMKKGVDISQIHIGLNSGNINVCVYINEKQI